MEKDTYFCSRKIFLNGKEGRKEGYNEVCKEGGWKKGK
jgi:hypothetical protein